MPGDSGVLVVTRVRSTTTKCTRDRGCNGHPAFPTPSLGGRFINGSGASRGEVANVCLRRLFKAIAPHFQSSSPAKEPVKNADLILRSLLRKLLRMKSEMYFTIAKAGDPVFRGVSYGNASLRGTGYSAFAEYDGVARSDLSAGAQRAKADATWQCCLNPPSSPTARADGRSAV